MIPLTFLFQCWIFLRIIGLWKDVPALWCFIVIVSKAYNRLKVTLTELWFIVGTSNNILSKKKKKRVIETALVLNVLVQRYKSQLQNTVYAFVYNGRWKQMKRYAIREKLCVIYLRKNVLLHTENGFNTLGKKMK